MSGVGDVNSRFLRSCAAMRGERLELARCIIGAGHLWSVAPVEESGLLSASRKILLTTSPSTALPGVLADGVKYAIKRFDYDCSFASSFGKSQIKEGIYAALAVRPADFCRSGGPF